MSESVVKVKSKSKPLWRDTSLVSLMTLISRVMGFLRDMVIAQYFGAGVAVDAYLVAFKIPSFMRRLFAEGAFAQAFVPVLSEYREQQNVQQVRQFISHMAGLLGLVLLLITLLAMLFAPYIVHVFAPGFVATGQRFALSAAMLRITFPYLLFISLAALAGAVLNTYGRFGIPAFTPVLLNLTLIIAAVWGAPHFRIPIMALAWGVCIAGIIQLCFQLPALIKLRLCPLPIPNWRDSAVRRVLKLMVPAIFGVSVAQINILVDTIFASLLPVGSVSWLYYSDRLSQFPLGVFGVAIATVILPHLSRKHATASKQDFAATLDWALRCILFIGIPAALGLLFLALPVLATLFRYGHFKAHDALMAAQSLRTFAVGIPAFMLIKVLATGFYAQQNIKTPVKVGVLALVTNTVLNLILIWPLKHAGLALATSLAAWLNAGLLAYLLIKAGTFSFSRHWLGFLLRLTFANVAMSLFLFFAIANNQYWFAWPAYWRGGMLLGLVMLAILIYFSVLLLSGWRLRDLSQQRYRG